MQKIVPALWFNNNAEEAVEFYVSVFKNALIHRRIYYGEAGPEAANKVMLIEFQLEGQPFVAINSSADFPFSPAISLIVNCANQQEIDLLWHRLAYYPLMSQSGWLRDRYGLSWQILTPRLAEMLADGNAAKAQRVMAAMLAMKKINLSALEAIYAASD